MFFQASLVLFYLVAFASATHDIAADGYYLLATTEKEQAFYVGIRSTFFRIANIFGQGLLVILAGYLQSSTGLPKREIQFTATSDAPLVQSLESSPVGSSPLTELQVLVQTNLLSIRTGQGDKATVSSMIADARKLNASNGHYVKERTAPTPGRFSNIPGKIGSILTAPFRWLGGVLEPFLREHFGANSGKAGVVGNIAVIQIRLSHPPGKEIVITPAFKSGDKSIALAEGARLVFDDSSWNKPALAVFQLDPKLKSAAGATFEIRSGNIAFSWTVTFLVVTGLMALFGLWHKFILPKPAKDVPGNAQNIGMFFKEFFKTFGSFFAKERIGVLLAFLLLYRFGESQLMKMVVPFLLDAREVGGLGLTTGQVGWVYGTMGIIGLTCGGLLGGMVASRHGLKAWLWAMVGIIHLPDAIFIYLAYAQPDSLAIITACVAIEQFGYGFGFTAYMLYMIYIARGKHQTAHYAICTGFMALGMMLPGMWSGWLQEIIGYQHFFVWVILATIPSFLVVLMIPLDREFGKKAN
jgi:PAT family beta-lactamase induction signal transducer AmpG